MSSVSKLYSHSSVQTADDPVVRQPDQNNPASPAHAEHVVDPTAGNDDDPEYPEALPDDLLPPPDFRPFFTLIEDPDTGEHHHPAVHYVFSDDNHDFVTSAIVDSMEQEQTESPTEQQSAGDHERMILLDVGPDGKTITNAQSLSPDWQILKSTVGQAPSWADEVSRKDIPGLMLNIQGLESHKLRLQPNRRRNSQDDLMARVEAMIGGYNDCLATLESLVKKDVVEQEEEESNKDETAVAPEES